MSSTHSSTPTQVEIAIVSDPAHLPEVREHIRKTATACGFPEADVDGIALAIDEALANVIKHGYGGAKDGKIELNLIPIVRGNQPGGLEIRIRDYGCQVDPAQICGRDLEDVRPGGLGVHIIKSVMDEVVYAPCSDCGMSVTLRKFRGP